MTTPFDGLWPAMLTPLTPDGRPSLPACEQLVELFAREKLGGIYLGGSTGQWPLLTVAERKDVAECVVAAAGKRLPVMVHVGAVATARSGTASSLINVARMAGATIGVAVLGSVFAFAGGDEPGLRAAMLLGGGVQLACAAFAWSAKPKEQTD